MPAHFPGRGGGAARQAAAPTTGHRASPPSRTRLRCHEVASPCSRFHRGRHCDVVSARWPRATRLATALGRPACERQSRRPPHQKLGCDGPPAAEEPAVSRAPACAARRRGANFCFRRRPSGPPSSPRRPPWRPQPFPRRRWSTSSLSSLRTRGKWARKGDHFPTPGRSRPPFDRHCKAAPAAGARARARCCPPGRGGKTSLRRSERATSFFRPSRSPVGRSRFRFASQCLRRRTRRWS